MTLYRYRLGKNQRFTQLLNRRNDTMVNQLKEHWGLGIYRNVIK